MEGGVESGRTNERHALAFPLPLLPSTLGGRDSLFLRPRPRASLFQFLQFLPMSDLALDNVTCDDRKNQLQKIELKRMHT